MHSTSTQLLTPCCTALLHHCPLCTAVHLPMLHRSAATMLVTQSPDALALLIARSFYAAPGVSQQDEARLENCICLAANLPHAVAASRQRAAGRPVASIPASRGVCGGHIDQRHCVEHFYHVARGLLSGTGRRHKANEPCCRVWQAATGSVLRTPCFYHGQNLPPLSFLTPPRGGKNRGGKDLRQKQGGKRAREARAWSIRASTTPRPGFDHPMCPV